METRDRLTLQLIKLIKSRSASSFYLNGPPGSGKSHLLTELSQQLPREMLHCIPLGPYAIKWSEYPGLGNKIVDDCRAFGYLDDSALPQPDPDLVTVWQWISEHIEARAGKTFLVLLDLVESCKPDLTVMGSLFSSVRYLEGTWNSDRLRMHHLLAGYWNQEALRDYYKRINTSFPYTVGHNYITWPGLSAGEMVDLMKQKRPDEASLIYGQLLFELTGGHAAAALEILEQIEPGELSLLTLLAATREVAVRGTVSSGLLEIWRQLPLNVRSLLQELIFKRQIAANFPEVVIDQLSTAGIIRQEQLGAKAFLSFNSWFVELLVRSHSEDLLIANEQTQRIRWDELIPGVSTLNCEAYRLINDIENAARNFAAIQLSLSQNDNMHILEGRNRRLVDGDYEDQYQRALNWQNRSKDRGLETDLNPLLTYCSTSELANLIREIGREMNLTSWVNIAQAIRGLVNVRDAVMHNQLINDQDLQRLYDLRLEMYDALSELK